ncbi:MAG: response regulator [candidate division Zixibacteria bacterium]|nr:response regulator [candidate division Zixibacteria bacterium]
MQNDARRVLIVDDNPNMSNLLSDMLEVFEFSSQRAADGEEALSLLNQNEFSLLITDLRMPKMSGLELLKTVKDKYPKLPVVVITGYSTEATENELLSAKADGFLNKPFRMNDIETVLRKFALMD